MDARDLSSLKRYLSESANLLINRVTWMPSEEFAALREDYTERLGTGPLTDQEMLVLRALELRADRERRE